MMSQRVEARARELAAGLTDTMVTTLLQTIGRELDATSREAGQAQGENNGLATATRTLARELVFGIDDGLNGLAERVDAGESPPSMLSRIESTSDHLPRLFWIVTVGAALLLVAFAIWV